MRNSGHVGFFWVPLIGLMLGMVATTALIVVLTLVAVVTFGLFGTSLPAPTARILCFVFSAVFVIVTIAGWASWIADKFRKDTTHD